MNTLDVQKIVVDVSAKPSKFEPRHKKILGSQNTVFQTTYVPSLPPSVQLYFSITEIKFLLYHAAFCRMKNRRLSFRPNKAQLKLLKLFYIFCIWSKKQDHPPFILDLNGSKIKKSGLKLARVSCCLGGLWIKVSCRFHL